MSLISAESALNKLKDKIYSDAHFAELIKGSGISFVFKILGIVCGYIFTFLVTRTLGAKAWGIFTLSFTVLQIISVVGRLGLDTALLRFVAENLAQKKWELIRKIYFKALKLVIPFSLTLSLILYLLSPFIAKYVFHKEYLTNSFRIASIGIAPFVLLFLHRECIRGLKKIREYALLNSLILPLLASLVLLPLSFLFEKKYHIPIVAYIISILIASAFSFSLWMRNINFQHLPQLSSKSTEISYKYLLSVSIPMLLSSSMFLVMQWTDTIMLGMFSTEKNVGVYNVALKLASLTSLPLIAINTIAAPKFAEFWGKKDFQGLKRVVQQSTKLIFWSSFPILLSFLLFPSQILNIFGSEFKAGATALTILTFGQFVNAISGSVGYILQMTGNQKIFQNIILVATTINIVLNVILIPKFGIRGAAFASMVSCIYWNIAGSFYIMRKYQITTIYIPSFFHFKRSK